MFLSEIIIGADDDLPPSHPTRVSIGGNFAGNGRSIVGYASYSRVHSDMEAQIHLLEQEAYCSVLRAFKAQSDAITWVYALLYLHLLVLTTFPIYFMLIGFACYVIFRKKKA